MAVSGFKSFVVSSPIWDIVDVSSIVWLIEIGIDDVSASLSSIIQRKERKILIWYIKKKTYWLFQQLLDYR